MYTGAVPQNAGLPSMMPPHFPGGGVPSQDRTFAPHQSGPQSLPPQFPLPGQVAMPTQQVHLPAASTQHAMLPNQIPPQQSGLLQQQNERRLHQDPSMPQYPSG